MNENKCPKCGMRYSEGAKICLLCGSELPLVSTHTEPKVSYPKKKRKKLKSMDAPDIPVIEVEITPPSDNTDKPNKKAIKGKGTLEKLQEESEELRKELTDFEEVYKKEHPEKKPWYTSFGVWFALFLATGCLYMVYRWVKIEGGIPHEITDFIKGIF